MQKTVFNFLEFVRRIFSGKFTHSLPFIGRIYHFFYSYLKPDFVKNDWGILYLDRGDILGLLRNNGISGKFMTELVKKNIKKGDTAVDLGAHIGYFTTLFSNLVGNEGKVIAFEPDEKTFSILSKNISVNNLKNVYLSKLAVADKSGDANFYLYGSGISSLGNLADMPDYLVNKNAPVARIYTTTLDNFFNSERVDFIKMDIEGSEGLALKGGEKLLSRKNLKILTEFTIQILERASKTSGKEFIQKLFDFGFKVYEVDEINERLNEITEVNLNDYIKKAGTKTNDIFCVK